MAILYAQLIHGVIWDRFDLPGLLQFSGTAGEPWRTRAQPELRIPPRVAPAAMGQHAA